MDNISADVRRVIGLMHTCGWTRAHVKRNLMLPRSEIERVFREIDGDPELQHLAEVGLGLDGAVEAMSREAVICRECHAFLSIVPCVTCSLNGVEDEPWDDEEDLPESVESTESVPGSLEKLLVMRERAERGLSVFCKDDRPYSWCA